MFELFGLGDKSKNRKRRPSEPLDLDRLMGPPPDPDEWRQPTRAEQRKKEQKHRKAKRVRLGIFLGLLGATGIVSLGALINHISQSDSGSIDQQARGVLSGNRGGLEASQTPQPEVVITQEITPASTAIAPGSTPAPSEEVTQPPRQVRNWQNRPRTGEPATEEPQPTLVEPTMVATEPISTPAPTAENQPTERRTAMNGLTVFLSEEGIPIGFRDPVTQERRDFSAEEIAGLERARQEAISSGLPAISQELTLTPANQAAETEESPKQEIEAPDDLVLPETLREEYGITIFNSSNVTLDIREAAFQPGGLLERQAEYKDATNSQLFVVLIDDFVVSSRTLDDTVPQELRNLISAHEIDITEYRQYWLDYYQQHAREAEQALTGTPQEISGLVADYHAIEFYQQASDDELMLQAQQSLEDKSAGLYMPVSPYLLDGQTVFASVIFLAVGPLPVRSHTLATTRFYFTPDGTAQIFNSNEQIYQRGGFEPDPENSFPQVEDLVYRAPDDPTDYIIGAQIDQPGITFAHELSHHNLLTVLPRLTGIAANNSEAEADRETIEYLSQADMSLEQGNNTGYQFVFRGPRGVQITKPSRN